MAGEFQNLGVALKTVYPSKAIEAIINEESPFREKLAKSVPAGAKVSEGSVKFNGVLALPQNVAQIVDGDDLMDIAERSEVQFTLLPTIFQASAGFGWLTQKAANSDKSSFNGGEVRRRTNETVGNLGKFIEQTYLGTTGNGVRGYVESSAAGGIVIKQPEGLKFLRQGHKITIRDSANFATIRNTLDGVRIATANNSTRTIVLAGPPTHTNALANDVVLVVSKAAQALTSLFANGLRGLVDDGTNSQYIHTQDRTTAANVRLKSVVNTDANLRDLSEQIMLRVCTDIHEMTGKRVSDIWCGPGQVEKWIQFVAPDRRRQVSGGTYDKGIGIKSYDELSFYAPGVNAKINVSYDVVPREMYFLNWDTFFHYVAKPMDWVDQDGLMHMAIGTGTYKAAWQYFMAGFENIGNDMPAANGVARNLKDPTIGDV